MNECYVGTAVSLVVHGLVGVLVLGGSLTSVPSSLRVVEMDFSLLKDQPRQAYAVESFKKVVERKQVGLLKGDMAPRGKYPMDRPIEETYPMPPHEENVISSSVPTIVTASDAHGEVTVYGVEASYAGSSGESTRVQPHGSKAGSLNGDGRGTGEGGESLEAGGKDYSYIREAVMRNLKYPEEARRLGLEGKVILSFVVVESGITKDIRITNSSGYKLLDESAKNAVAVTRIARRAPYRVIVRLPITFRLQGNAGERL